MAWFDTLSEEQKGFVTTHGLSSLADDKVMPGLLQHAMGLQAKLGPNPENLIRWPTDANDATWATIHEKLGVPKDASGYSFGEVKFKDGSPLDAETATALSAFAAENKIPAPQAAAFAKWLAGRADTDADEQMRQTQIATEAGRTDLRRKWGAEYDMRHFRATKAGEVLGLTPQAIDEVGAKVGLVAFMEQLDVLGSRMSEHTLLGGGGSRPNQQQAYTTAQAAERKNMLIADPNFRQRFITGDSAAVAEMQHLDRIIVGAPAA